MTDNVAITPGAGATIATDDVGGVQYQRVKMAVGTDGTATDVSASNPIPAIMSDVADIRFLLQALVNRTAIADTYGRQPVIGSVTVSNTLNANSSQSGNWSVGLSSYGMLHSWQMVQQWASDEAWNSTMRSKLTVT